MKVSKPKVMKSNAGFYIGQEYFDTECQCWFPYDRLSGYYATRKEAEKALPSYQD